MFDFVGAFGLSLTAFTLPGAMYLILQRDEKAKHDIETPSSRKCNTVGSYLAIIVSIVNMILVVVKIFV